MHTLELQHIQMEYANHKQVLCDIQLHVDKKSFIVIAGPSGCGKSTLLQIIAGLLKPTAGNVVMNGMVMNDVLAHQRHVAMVFQDPSLFDHLRVKENIMIGMDTCPEAELLSITDKLHITPLLSAYGYALSGGQKQRVAMARALIRKPQFFLMDEPLQSLDEQLKRDLRLVIADLYQQHEATFLYVTHDQKEAMTLGEYMILMNEGKIVQVGTPQELYKHPKTLFVASFMDKYRLNIIEGEQIEGIFQPRKQGSILGAIRSEHLFLENDTLQLDVVMQGSIRLVEEMGNGAMLHVDVDGRSIVMHGGMDTHQRGDIISFGFSQSDVLLFDQHGERLN